MEILSFFGLLTIFPLGATIIGALCLLVFVRAKISTGIATGTLWMVYSIYEYLMYTRVLCSGECNIRIDLLVIYPLLIGLSVVSIVLYVVAKFRRRDEGKQ